MDSEFVCLTRYSINIYFPCTIYTLCLRDCWASFWAFLTFPILFTYSFLLLLYGEIRNKTILFYLILSYFGKVLVNLLIICVEHLLDPVSLRENRSASFFHCRLVLEIAPDNYTKNYSDTFGDPIIRLFSA